MLRVKCVGSALEVWYNPAGTPGAATLSATDGNIGWGGVALSGWDALFDNLKVGYDADDDDDLDGSDDVVIDEDFSSTSVSPTHDDAGNLTKDADYAYVYDGWNNLVKVRAQNDADVVVGVYAYYADNRRASKTVTNRGDLDGVTYFFYDGLREIEERNGSEQVTQQYVWGHEYLDQLLMIRGAGGTWFVHQDANWNVIALTTPNGDVAEEVQYQPYGLPQVKRHLAFGDSDADGDVDASDNTARTNALSTYNRAFDADFDGDVSNTSGDADQEAWDASYNDPSANVTMVVANRGFSPSGNPFLFTGRRLDAETGLYFYRFRTYHPTLKTFLQRDPLGYVDGPSQYVALLNNPLLHTDPLGWSSGHAGGIAGGSAWAKALKAFEAAKAAYLANPTAANAAALAAAITALIGVADAIGVDGGALANRLWNWFNDLMRRLPPGSKPNPNNPPDIPELPRIPELEKDDDDRKHPYPIGSKPNPDGSPKDIGDQEKELDEYDRSRGKNDDSDAGYKINKKKSEDRTKRDLQDWIDDYNRRRRDCD